MAVRKENFVDGSWPKTGKTIVRTHAGKIIGNNLAILKAVEQIELCAPTHCNVLITGESGTGKELVAARVHEASMRRDARYVPFNCATFTDSLADSELFGHVKGAFTGSHADHNGLVAEAEGGTLFLDEIGELSLSIQAKLLRLIQERVFRPVGGVERKCDVRIVAATHRDLMGLVRAKRFREDLYYRLNVMHVHLPPLRERGEDVATLANYFLRSNTEKMGRKDLLGFTEQAMEVMCKWRWPGNVRELANVAERLAITARETRVAVSDLPDEICKAAMTTTTTSTQESRPVRLREYKDVSFHDPKNEIPADGIELSEHLRAYEREMFSRALADTHNNISRAATLLGIKRTTFMARMKTLGIGEA
jgi:sigma-54 dependent transcriptional regulator, flagellar regulatory protein